MRRKGQRQTPRATGWQQQGAQKEDVNPIRGAGHRVMLEGKSTTPGQYHPGEGTFLFNLPVAPGRRHDARPGGP